METIGIQFYWRGYTVMINSTTIEDATKMVNDFMKQNKLKELKFKTNEITIHKIGNE